MHTMTPGQRSLGSVPVDSGQCWWHRPVGRWGKGMRGHGEVWRVCILPLFAGKAHAQRPCVQHLASGASCELAKLWHA